MTRSAATCLDGTVTRIQDLGPTFRRITFSGPGMADFGFPGDARDMRLKLVIPPPGTPADERLDLPALLAEVSDDEGASWYRTWLQVPEERRGAMRTYTVRAWRPETRELDVDMVLHTDADGTSGPAAAWAMNAQVGDRIHIIGPHREACPEGYGIEFLPGDARDLLLAGDETAVPAIASILSTLPDDATGVALLEVPSAEDVQELTAPAGLEVRWLVRGEQKVGARLDPAVRAAVRTPLCADSETSIVHRAILENDLEDVDIDATILWDVPRQLTEAARASGAGAGDAQPAQRRADGGEDSAAESGAGQVSDSEGAAVDSAGAVRDPRFYAWIAGEAGVVKALRRYLVREVGVDRRRVAFMGYWREGRAEG